MSARASRLVALEVLRLLTLLHAELHHMLELSGFCNFPRPSIFWTFAILNISSLSFSMPALYQMGTLFAIKRPLRIRGPITLALSVRLYCWLGVIICTAWHLNYPQTNVALRFPIFGGFSWFFTAHTVMTLISPFLHAGMQGLPFYGYVAANIGMIIYYMMADSHPFFVFANGY
jgi:hypothetical protein